MQIYILLSIYPILLILSTVIFNCLLLCIVTLHLKLVFIPVFYLYCLNLYRNCMYMCIVTVVRSLQFVTHHCHYSCSIWSCHIFKSVLNSLQCHTASRLLDVQFPGMCSAHAAWHHSSQSSHWIIILPSSGCQHERKIAICSIWSCSTLWQIALSGKGLIFPSSMDFFRWIHMGLVDGAMFWRDHGWHRVQWERLRQTAHNHFLHSATVRVYT